MRSTLRILAALAGFFVPDLAQASGCFVHAFAGEQYRPPMTTYTGPRHEPVFLPGASSVIVGPRAWLVGYAGRAYRKESLDLAPRARVPELAAMGFDHRVDAFKVMCADGDAQRP